MDIQDLVEHHKKLMIILIISFVLSTIVGYVTTIHFNALNKQSVEYKIKKGEMMKYIEPVPATYIDDYR